MMKLNFAVRRYSSFQKYKMLRERKMKYQLSNVALHIQQAYLKYTISGVLSNP